MERVSQKSVESSFWTGSSKKKPSLFGTTHIDTLSMLICLWWRLKRERKTALFLSLSALYREQKRSTQILSRNKSLMLVGRFKKFRFIFGLRFSENCLIFVINCLSKSYFVLCVRFYVKLKKVRSKLIKVHDKKYSNNLLCFLANWFNSWECFQL